MALALPPGVVDYNAADCALMHWFRLLDWLHCWIGTLLDLKFTNWKMFTYLLHYYQSIVKLKIICRKVFSGSDNAIIPQDNAKHNKVPKKKPKKKEGNLLTRISFCRLCIMYCSNINTIIKFIFTHYYISKIIIIYKV